MVHDFDMSMCSGIQQSHSEYEVAGSDSSDEDEDSDSLGADFESLLMNEGKGELNF